MLKPPPNQADINFKRAFCEARREGRTGMATSLHVHFVDTAELAAAPTPQRQWDPAELS